MRSVETPTTILTLRDDGVVVARVTNPEIPRTAETVHAVMEALVDIAGKERRPVVWDVRGSTIGSPESMAVFVGRIVDSVSALGLLLDEETSRALQSRIDAFTPAVEALLIPVRVFNDEAEATAWVREFV